MPNYLDQGFGIELECYLPEGMTQQICSQAINQRLGTTTVRPEGYNHQRRPHWKIVSDGSLGDYLRGIEVVSPVLHGEDGIREAEQVTRTLEDLGCTVSRKCGFHVHVGVGPNPDINFWRNIVKLYAMFEPVLDSLMPPSRRGSANPYCQSLTQTNLTRLASASTLSDVRFAARMNGRFYKLNLESFARHRTVEFRQHSGTLHADKVSNWIRVCLRIVAKATAGFATTAAPAAVVPAPTLSAPAPAPVLVNRARYGTKSWVIGNMMMRPEGVTAAEAMEAVNWPSVSLPQQARICGLDFTTQRMGRTIRYFARNAAAIAMVAPAAPAVATSAAPQQETFPITLDGFIAAIGADDQRTYLVNRTRNLSGSIDWAA